MLQYPKKVPIDVTLCYMAWRNVKNLNQILHFWNLWVNPFQTVYRLSKSVDILEEASNSEIDLFRQNGNSCLPICRLIAELHTFDGDDWVVHHHQIWSIEDRWQVQILVRMVGDPTTNVFQMTQNIAPIEFQIQNKVYETLFILKVQTSMVPTWDGKGFHALHVKRNGGWQW